MLFRRICLTLFLVAGCTDNSTQPLLQYDQMCFARYGGGNLEFNLSPAAETDIYSVNVHKVAFKDTLISLYLIKDAGHSVNFNALNGALHGQIQISGDFRQSTMINGTWVYIYLLRGNDSTEVTNTDLRNLLLAFEPLVREKMK